MVVISVSYTHLADGITRFMVGLAKKLILADGLASLADKLAPMDAAALEATPALGVWMGILFYMLQIYLDFSAYSDMAIGMGSCLLYTSARCGTARTYGSCGI